MCDASVSQLVEETASKSVQCGFESHPRHVKARILLSSRRAAQWESFKVETHALALLSVVIHLWSLHKEGRT